MVVEETFNYLRKRVHSLDLAGDSRLVELEVLENNGVPEARVFEVRLYGADVSR